MASGIAARIRGAGLGTRLVLASVLISVVTVTLTFVALSLELRGHTRDLLSQTLSQHQNTIAGLQQRGLQEVLRASTLMSENPTLLAAMETYRLEASPGTGHRADLIATIQTETARIAGGMGRDLLIVTDPAGTVLAADGAPAGAPLLGLDLSDRRVIGYALAQDKPVGPDNFAVVRLAGESYQVGSVPILLQGYIAGTLTLGDRIDEGFARALGDSFDSEVVVTAGSEVITTTLPSPPDLTAARPEEVVEAAGAEYVVAPLELGRDEDDRQVTLHLLRSLTGSLAAANRSLLMTISGYGVLMVLAAALTAWLVSRSVLRPLERLVGFMRSASDSGDRSGRFEAGDAAAEVKLLASTFNGLMASLQDRERRLMEKAREDIARVERLKESEKLAALGRMLSGAAHEINNPMTGVIGNIDLILQQRDLDADLRERLERIRKEGHRIVALTRNLLKIARRDGGPRTSVEINQLLRETVELRRRDFERAGIELRLDLAESPIRLTASEIELQQVFVNIINNAYDALKEAGGPRSLEIRTSASDGRATIVMQDDGPGLKEPSQVFEHFYTTKPVGQGTGLGLSISQATVQGHGGTLTADNVPGAGARFTIVLPRGEGSPVAGVASRPEASAPTRPGARSLQAEILVVDDEEVVLELQMAILDSLGARAIASRSGDEALELLQSRDFDLIVSDVTIPGDVSGQELFEWAARHRARGTRGFVFMSGSPLGEEGFVKRSRSRCLAKPFEMEEYVTTLREALDELHAAD